MALLIGLVVAPPVEATDRMIDARSAQTLGSGRLVCHTWHASFHDIGHDTVLRSVAAISSTDAWAVGDKEGAGALIEHYDGRDWTVSYQDDNTNWSLGSVSAISADDVWAVGTQNLQNLTLHWDGTKWSRVPAPDASADDYLLSVVALSSDAVWAAGYSQLGLLWLYWDGTRWTAHLQRRGGVVNSLSAVSADDVWAAGYGGFADRPMLVHWDGRRWRQAPPAPSDGSFTAIHAVSAGDVWAVGDTGDQQPLVQHFDGIAWSNIPAPWIGVMTGVWGSGPDDAWVVGRYVAPSGWLEPASEHWDGAAWSIVPTPQLGQSSVPEAVTGTSADDVWAVGYVVHGNDDSLMLHSRGLCP